MKLAKVWEAAPRAENKAKMEAELVKIGVKLQLEKVSKNVQKKVPLCTANPH